MTVTSADTAGNEVNNPNKSLSWQRKTKTRDLRPLTPERLPELVSETHQKKTQDLRTLSQERLGKRHRRGK